VQATGGFWWCFAVGRLLLAASCMIGLTSDTLLGETAPVNVLLTTGDATSASANPHTGTGMFKESSHKSAHEGVRAVCKLEDRRSGLFVRWRSSQGLRGGGEAKGVREPAPWQRREVAAMLPGRNALTNGLERIGRVTKIYRAGNVVVF
jgi:hypothetical protein